MEQYDSYELLKRGGAKLPIDNLQFIDPILNFSQEFKKSFYLAGVRHYLGCNGDNCCEAVKIVPGEEIKFVWEADNLYDKNAVLAFRIILSTDAEKHTKHIGKTARKGYNVKDDTPDKI